MGDPFCQRKFLDMIFIIAAILLNLLKPISLAKQLMSKVAKIDDAPLPQ